MQNIEVLFQEYKENWLRQTDFLSNMLEITNNYYYQQIIALGEDVIPLIIKDLKYEENHWFVALEKILGFTPIKNEHKGIYKLIKSDWLNYLEEKYK